MRKFNIRLFVLFLFSFSNTQSAVIYNACDAGWLGDQLMIYIKAKYLSYKYNVPFRLKPFLHSEKLVLSDVDQKISGNPGIKIKNENQLNSWSSTMYQVSFDCLINGWGDNSNYFEEWEGILENKQFVSDMKKLINVRNSNSLTIPGNASLAIHVRRPLNYGTDIYQPIFRRFEGSNLYDVNYLVEREVLSGASRNPFYKFLPDQYYLDQIKRIMAIIPEKKITVYIFTNDSNPKKICDEYAKELNTEDISFICSSHSINTPQSQDAVNELILMSRFDYFIRSRSNYAQVADFIGNHKIVISPGDLAIYKNDKNKNCVVVETVIVKTKNEDGTYNRRIEQNI